MEQLKVIILPNEENQLGLLSDFFNAYGCTLKKIDLTEQDALTLVNENTASFTALDIQVNSLETEPILFEKKSSLKGPKGAKNKLASTKENIRKSNRKNEELKTAEDSISFPLSHPSWIETKKSTSSHGFIFKENLFIRSNSQLLKLKFEDIVYLEADANYTQVFTTEKKYTIRSSMKELQEKLADNRFARVHKSFLINLEKIESIQAEFIQISGKEIPIGRLQYSWLLRQIKIL